MLLIPAYIGVGFLGLPYIVKLLGLWGGSCGLLFYGILNELGALVLVSSTRRLTERTGERFGDLGSVLEKCIELGPSCLQRHCGKFRAFLDCCIFVMYLLYMNSLISLMNLLRKDILHQYIDISDTLSIVVICGFLLPVYLTRRLGLLSFIATAGNAALLGVFIISFQYICRDLPDFSKRPSTKFVDYLTVTAFTNDAMFSYAGIVMVLPVRNRVTNKKTFDGWNGVLGVVLVIIISFHVGCGFFGYLKFGEMTQTNFLLNLPEDDWIYKSLRILSFFALYCLMGSPVFVIVEIIWPPLKNNFSTEIVKNYGEYLCRVVLLMVTCTITILIPEFELLMSLAGCFGVIFTQLILPYIIAVLVFYEDESSLLIDKVKRKLVTLGCVSMFMFGIYSMVAGIAVAVYMALFHVVL